MLLNIVELKNNRILKKTQQFFSSIWFMVVVGILTVCSNILGIEIAVYWLFTLFVVLITLFAKSTISFVPMLAMGYMTISNNNNPATEDNSIFYQSYFKINMIFIVSIILICFTVRFIYECFFNKENDIKKKRMPQLTYGFIALGAAYLFGGILSHNYNIDLGSYQSGTNYSIKTFLYGLLQLISVAGIYFYMYFTVSRKDVNLEYAIQLLCVMGFVVGLQVGGMYLYAYLNGGFENFNRMDLKIGWGCYNNLGGMMALAVPAPLYYLAKGRKGILSGLISCLFLLFVFFTQSRGSILFSIIIFISGIIVALKYNKQISRKKIAITAIIILCIIIIIIGIFHKQIYKLFKSFIDIGLSGNNRFNVYKGSLEYFIVNPIFGNGFYIKIDGLYGELLDGSFLPPRCHNTIIQMLCTSGIVGLGLYIYHRIQTLKLALKDNNIQSCFMFLSVGVLLLTSLLDNHFFNLGPGLVYSILLFFIEVNKEYCNPSKKLLHKKPCKK